jgi:Protein of unknown function (DUF4229)
VKEFAVYTLARIGLFVASALVLLGLFRLLGSDSLLLPLLLAAVVSGLASYYLLRGQRERFAARVEARAHAATRAFEERRAREDED